MKLEQPSQIVSYFIGRQIGDQLQSSRFPGFDVELVSQGIRAALAGEPVTLSQAEIAAAFDVIQEQVRESQAAQAKEASAEGIAFLKNNAGRDGVVTTPSGLQYEIIVQGQGARPTRDSTVRTHYHGMFIDGSVFDSSVERGEPAEFPVTGVIAGWTEALQLMQEGSKWRLFLPSDLAYGERGSSGAIPPGATLVFEVELLQVLD